MQLFQITVDFFTMGRPKGSKSQPKMDINNILPSTKVNDENDNQIPDKCPQKKSKKSGTRTSTKSASLQQYLNLVGPAIDFFPKYKLPQNKVVLQSYRALREKFPKQKLFKLVNMLYDELVNLLWVPARMKKKGKSSPMPRK